MKPRNLLLTLTALLLLALNLACSGGGSPLMPSGDSDAPPTSPAGQFDFDKNQRLLWSVGEITFDPFTQTAEIIPARDIETHYNILGFLEYAPCTDCIQITNIEPMVTETGWNFDIQITHPFDDPKFTAFDVRLITIFAAHFSWEESDTWMSNLEHGDCEMVNADGHTQLYNYKTVGAGPGGLQGMIKGKLGTELNATSELNAYKSYESDIPDNDRNAFIAGDTVTRTISIQWPETLYIPWKFSYAVDASWAMPDGTGEDLDDFPAEANCPEPYDMDVSYINVGPGLHQQGGSVIVKIRVKDHPPYISHLAPKIEAPDFEYEIQEAKFYGLEGLTPVWHCQIENKGLAQPGTYRMLISVEDVENASAPDHLDLTYYKTVELEVKSWQDKWGWAETWGDVERDWVTAVEADKAGNIYVGGQFEGAVDFDPGPDDVSVRTSMGLRDCFLAKYDVYGNFKWVKSWGGVENDYLNAIELDDYDNLYVGGRFGGTADFDPSTNEWNRTANGDPDAYVTKFDFTGNWHWVRSWGGSGDDSATGLSFDNDELYICGRFEGETDFGLSGDLKVSNGSADAYIVEMDYSTSHTLSSMTWGGDQFDAAYGIDFMYDWDYGMGDAIYVCGSFKNNSDLSGIDFDPSSGVDIKTAVGSLDAYVMRIDAETDTYAWTRTWGSEAEEVAMAVNANVVNGWAVGGYTGGVIDLDPTDGSNLPSTHHGLLDCFIATFEEDDDSFKYGHSFGGPGNDYITDIDGDVFGNPLVCGTFTSDVDFDPTDGVEMHSSNGGQDAFVASYNIEEGFYWATTWGGPYEDYAYAITGGEHSISYTGGCFAGTVDFNPEGGDEHTSYGNDDAFLMKLMGHGLW